jgi:hypothetical protein
MHLAEISTKDIIGHDWAEDVQNALEDIFGVQPELAAQADEARITDGRGTNRTSRFAFPWTAAFAFCTATMVTQLTLSAPDDIEVGLRYGHGAGAVEFIIRKTTTHESLIKFFIQNGISLEELKKIAETQGAHTQSTQNILKTLEEIRRVK